MCERVPKLLSALILPCFLMCGYPHCTLAVTVSSDSEASTTNGAHSLGRSFALCFTRDEKLRCFEEVVVQALDEAIASNNTWHFSDVLAIEKTQAVKGSNGSYSYWTLLQQQQQKQRQQMQPQHARQERSFGDTIGEKLLQLAEGRSVRLQMPRPQSSSLQLLRLDGKGITNGISDAIDEINSGMPFTSLADSNQSPEEGTLRVLHGLVDDKIELISSGRRRKDKDKNMATIGGMAMMAMMAQMFFGKVILIAGGAFVMAKIALVIAVLGSLKKGSASSIGGTEHVIVASGSGLSSHDSGWHRSMPHNAHPYVDAYSAGHPAPPPMHSAPPSPAHHGGSRPSHHTYQITETSGEDYGADEHEEGSEFKRRRNRVVGFL